MAGGRLPTEIVLLRRKKHFTKQEIEERKASELKPQTDKAIKPPSYLTQDLKKEFKRIAKDLVDIGIMSNLDVDSLARFLQVRKMYLEVTNELLNQSPVITIEKEIKDEYEETIDTELVRIPNDTYSELLNMQNKLFTQCRQSSADLGLTITSRVKLVVPKKEEEKPPTKEEELFGDNL